MSCFNCQHEFKENEGRYSHSDGMLCKKCEENIEKLNLVPNETLFEKGTNISFLENQELGKYTVDGKLLAKYVSATNYLKFFTTITIGKPDMFIIDNIIRQKELIKKELFTNVNLPYNLTGVDSNAKKFLELINEWTEGTIKCPATQIL